LNLSRNKILYYSDLLATGVYYLILFLFLVFLAFIASSYFIPEALAPVTLNNPFNPGYGTVGLQLHPSVKNVPENAFQLSDLNGAMLAWMIIRQAFFVWITILIIKRIKKVIKSVEALKTFYQENIKHFKQIAKLAFVGFVFSCFNFSYIDGDFSFRLKIIWGPLILSMLCLLLTEIFKEGKQLLEDKNSII